MESLAAALPIFIYILLIGVLIIAIILGIKAIRLINKIDKIMDDIKEKLEVLNPLFEVIDGTTKVVKNGLEKISGITSSIKNKLSFLKKERER